MKPEYLISYFAFFKTAILGYSVYAVYDFPLFVTLPLSLFVSLVPLIGDGLTVYYGARAFEIGFRMAGLYFFLIPFMLIVVLPCVYVFRHGIVAGAKKKLGMGA